MEIIIYSVVGLLGGGLLSALLTKSKYSNKLKDAQKIAQKIIQDSKKEAETIKKDKLLQAKEKFLQLKSEHEKSISNREQKISEALKRVKEKESKLNIELGKNKRFTEKLQEKTNAVKIKSEALENTREELDKEKQKHIVELEKIATLSVTDAKSQLLETLKDDVKGEAMAFIQNTVEESKLTAQSEAKKIIINTIQRIGTEEAIENCISTFHLDSDEMKGKIIGREGRNIRALEAETGVEIIVDDTPETIIISCFDPVRREIARLSLQKLVSDGRIHPARIEDVVKKITTQIDESVIQTGKQTVIELGIHGVHPDLIKKIGRMKFRSSYGQNLLQHSKEVAKLCSTMASELGINYKLAKRAGLLHDIGKVSEEEHEKPHALLGMQWAEECGEKQEVLNAIGAHHDEIEMTSLISPIVQVCDAISGARPGVRKQMTEAYIKRLKDLEKMAFSFNGVKNAYAIQAGRELRVIVDSDQINDDESAKLAYDLSHKIQSEMTYPGQVKVTIIREIRATNIAK